MVALSDEQPNEQAAKKGIQDQRLSSCTEDKKIEIRKDLPVHSKNRDTQESRTTSATVLNDQEIRRSTTEKLKILGDAINKLELEM